MRCIGCDTEIEDLSSEFCPACHAALSSPTASDALDQGPPSQARRVDPPPRLPSGTVIADRYRIVRHLGSGGMGIVYQADDLKLNVPVALKFLNPGETAGQRRLELFLNEVRLARQITHPNVCRIFDVAEVDGRHFLSMEHVDGEDLASLLRRIGRLPKDRAVAIALEICRGLEAAHDRGILHRDLKPSNLMIDAHGRAKIMDFGLANFGRGPGPRGEVAGTPGYMAPEQRRGESSIQTEVYALGLVLYELFTGRRAHRALIMGDTADSSAPSASLLDDLDPVVERVIRHCLELDRRLRPSSVSAVTEALARLTVPPWRPAEGLSIPHRRHWMLERKLGQGGFGDTWVAVHTKTHDRRVFKFCTDVGKLTAFQREVTLFRFMRQTLGGRDDIAAIVDWQLDEPPYFIESEFAASVNLSPRVASQRGWSHCGVTA
jgi:serine/threonine-protein kinase